MNNNDAKKQKFKTFALFFSVFVFVCGGILASRTAIIAADPSGVHATVYQTDLLQTSASTPVSIFTATAGVTVDIVGNPNAAFGSGTVNVGSYKRIHFKVKNLITWDGPDPCNGANPPLTNQQLLIDGSKTATAVVDLVFATSDDGGSSGWTANGTPANPFLLQTAINVESNVNTVVKLMFNTAGTVQCVNSSASLLPPDMSTVTYVEKAAVATGSCSFNTAQKYWFVHYNFNNWVKSYLISNGTPTAIPTQDEVLSNSGVNVGWGAITFEALDSSGTGTWTVDPRIKASASGMTEHRHNLRGWDPFNKPNEGLNDPSGPSATGVQGGTYTVAGQKLIMYFPEGGYAEGAVSSDCSTFVGTNITTPGENDIIFAIKKPATNMNGTGFPAGKYQMIANALDITYDKTTSIPWSSPTGTAYPTGWMSFQPNPMFLDTTAFSNTGGMFGWKPMYSLGRQWGATGGNTGWSSNGPEERIDWSADMSSQFASSTTTADGIWSNPTSTTDDAFIAFNERGNGIIAGSILEEDLRWTDVTRSQHYLQAGVIVKTATNPTLADLAGKWVIGVIESSIHDTDSTWNNGNEHAEFGLTYGEVTIGADGSVSRNFTHKDVFSGTITPDVGAGETVALVTECYAYDPVSNTGLPITTPAASCIIPGTSTPGMVNKVFHLKASDGSVQAKLALNTDTNTIVIFRPVDTGGVPYAAPQGVLCTQSPTPVANWCGDAQNNAVIGMGVKIQ